MAQFSTNNHLIYVVDDDAAIARLVSVNLAARGYRVKEFDGGSQAVAALKIDTPDLVILDIIMPEPDSLEVTRLIRLISQVSILILSVRDETADKLTALDMGADDYITKPFGIEELLAGLGPFLGEPPRQQKKSSYLVPGITGPAACSSTWTACESSATTAESS